MAVYVQYSPPPGIPARIASNIDAATSTILICIYHLTETTLASKLVAAVARGVIVQAILDYNAAYDLNSMAWTLSRGGVFVFTDHMHSLLHTKFAIFDSHLVSTGSANWSANADGAAAEDYVEIDLDYATAQSYIGNWNYHRSHSIALPR
jgi:phosphatidylserine/phosphatidylglycerophosphate/cardiolipin synthase-like enzyme